MLKQTRFRPAGEPVPAAAPPRAGLRAVKPGRRGRNFGTRVDGAGGCADVSRGGVRATYVPMSPAALGGDEGLRSGAVAPAALRLLRKRQTKDFASRPRCLCCCKLGSSFLAAAGPGPPWQRSVPAPCPAGGVSFCFPGSPDCAGKLQQENSSPLRNCDADTTHSAVGRVGGSGTQAHRQWGLGAPPPLQHPPFGARRREPAWPRAAVPVRGGGEGACPGSRTVPLSLLTCRGAPGCSTREAWAAGSGRLGEGQKAGASEDIL